MIRNKFLGKIALGLALAGVCTVGVVNTTATVASAAEQSQCSFKIDSMTGDYKTLNPTDYFLDCKNQGTVGTPITFTTNMSGSATFLGFTYSFSNKGVAKPADVYGPYTSEKYTWTPQTPGFYAVTVKAQDVNGDSQYATQYVEISDKLNIDSITSDHPKNNDFEVQGKAKLGETVNLDAVVSGGYKYGNKKYTYRVEPMQPTESNRGTTYYNLPSAKLAWTPKVPGVYIVGLTVTDELGNSTMNSTHIMIESK